MGESASGASEGSGPDRVVLRPSVGEFLGRATSRILWGLFFTVVLYFQLLSDMSVMASCLTLGLLLAPFLVFAAVALMNQRITVCGTELIFSDWLGRRRTVSSADVAEAVFVTSADSRMTLMTRAEAKPFVMETAGWDLNRLWDVLNDLGVTIRVVD